MSFFLLLNTKENILKNNLAPFTSIVFFFSTMDVNGAKQLFWLHGFFKISSFVFS